jgi:hypothetical protein
MRQMSDSRARSDEGSHRAEAMVDDASVLEGFESALFQV